MQVAPKQAHLTQMTVANWAQLVNDQGLLWFWLIDMMILTEQMRLNLIGAPV